MCDKSERPTVVLSGRTRAKQREMQRKEAENTEALAILRLVSADAVEGFAAKARLRTSLSDAVKELEVIIRKAGDTPSAPVFRSLFLAVSHITDLILLLPASTPSIFLDVHLHQLQLFCTNLPHAHLRRFVLRNTSINTLALGHCGSLAHQCPLFGTLSSHVTAIECPLECAISLIHPDVTRLSVDIRSSDTNVPQTLRALPPSKVQFVTLEHRPFDKDLLAAIKSAFPCVTDLALREIAATNRYRGERAPMRECFAYRQWSLALRNFTQLRNLTVQTSATLVRPIQDKDAETKLVRRWISSSGTVHPSLRLICLRYENNGLTQVESDWSLGQAGSWYQIRSTVVELAARSY